MKLIVQTVVDLSNAQVDEVFHKRLEELTEGLFEKNGMMWETVKTHTSWDRCACVGDIKDPKFAVPRAAIQLQSLMWHTNDHTSVHKK